MTNNTHPLRWVIPVIILIIVSSAGRAQTPGAAQANDRMPVTTSSAEARALFEQGLHEWQDLRTPQALQQWQAAIGKDPNFLLAHLYVSEHISDPAQQAVERKKVSALLESVTPDERLMSDWLIGYSRNDMLGSLAAMNDLLTRYPRDKQLYWFAALFMGSNYHQWERSAELAEQAVRIDPDFPGALNTLGYDYAYQGKFDQALAVMQHCINVLPGEPNPQSAYAEILRMAGRFPEAVEHYQAALKIKPDFAESLLGLADALALMGNEEQARAQYDIAIAHAYTEASTVMWKLRRAVTYLREKRLADADAAFLDAATMAHDFSMGMLEAEAYRTMALYQPNDAVAARWLRKAGEVLGHAHDTSPSGYQQELALIYRTAIYRALRQARSEAAAKSLVQLAQLSNESSNPSIDAAFHASLGAILVSKHKWPEAISHLEEDSTDPFSMELLVTAYRKAGLTAKSERMARQLAELNAPSVEQAIVVPDFRAKQLQSRQ
ncbi:MAG TPA: tetratricopeptide repeat protein [Candidatus Saccharimonadales bacterium]|jgi:tetratricopeptide (TPR) repeat protein|nr:tetratricopeptide repeat protein [Candidatus Saccharimonadales bacterium]